MNWPEAKRAVSGHGFTGAQVKEHAALSEQAHSGIRDWICAE